MRIEGWESRLNELLEKTHGESFEWGVCDCLMFSSDAVVACTGIDPMSKKKKDDPETIRGKYKSEAEARELIKKYRKSIRAIMDLHFDRKELPFCKRGDIVLYKGAFGVCGGRGIAYFKNESIGLEIVKIEDCLTAWDI